MHVAETDERSIIRNLLVGAGLPVDIVDDRKGDLWSFETNGRLIGCGAFEFYGTDALLRSVAVVEEQRGKGTGSLMVDLLEREAEARGVETIWLLTETAERFFRRKGFETVDRREVINKGLLDSAEFAHLCASTAVCMRKHMKSTDVKGET